VSANLDLVRSIYAAHERGDYSSTEWAHPQIAYEVADGPAPGRWTGLAAMAKAWGDILSTAEDVRAEVEEYREIDSERVLVLLQVIARGKSSQLEVGEMRTRGAALFQIRGGKVIKHAVYWDRENAFADLGLAPEGDLPDGEASR
jgi:ketosteroid isomerase-like protein